ncbi:FtsQ-type POTRA domain-containing protein [Microbacterium flavum]|uniref:FtsQ-type POTRA domain-containing protein n=1 Tax=Microbacterium flavum TaxID=415216 RepID=A0ABS5XSX1_9MICO|nr:FtsQ-type POTRA domain-containing protein [Microbacterium flavum]MBT8797061.1 FtsQ-type POTRA domain-containing protein [Microbacterium flavum]
MRRPSPLPQAPATQGTAPPEVEPPVAEPIRFPNPVAPAAAPEEEARALDERAGDAGESEDAAVITAAESDAIGVRDVWAAARARRKALRAEVRRFTARQRRRRAIWITVLAALAVLVLGTLGAAYSPLFAVEKVTVIGTQTLDPATVEQALADQIGTPLPRVDSSAVKAALVQFPLVESYTLEARPPHELVVRIVERTPIGSIESAAGYTLVDAAGVALSTTAEPPAGHPTITVASGVGSSAFAAVGTVFRALPVDIRAQVTAMSATTANDVTLTLGGTGTTVVWGNADRSGEKARVLAGIMTAQPPSAVSSYDVSSPDAVVVR